MPKGYEVERVSLKDEKRARRALPKGARSSCSTSAGASLTTAQFAKLLDGAETAFVIGGADGLARGDQAGGATCCCGSRR